jgi:hypothetical protein
VRVPLLVVVTGMPSSGKTTVAEALAGQLRLPLIAKDEIKECLYETLGAGDVSWSGRMGAAAYALIFSLARRMLSSGASIIVEANFFRDQEPEFASLPEHRLLQLLATRRSPSFLSGMRAGLGTPATTMRRRSRSFLIVLKAAPTRR